MALSAVLGVLAFIGLCYLTMRLLCLALGYDGQEWWPAALHDQ